MNKDEIRKIAIQAGFFIGLDSVPFNVQTIEDFAKLVAHHEREACAKVCDDINAKYKWPDDVAERVASQWCADSIRARGQA
jgi:uncharacterized protein involved in tolerance to divalent cations